MEPIIVVRIAIVVLSFCRGLESSGQPPHRALVKRLEIPTILPAWLQLDHSRYRQDVYY